MRCIRVFLVIVSVGVTHMLYGGINRHAIQKRKSLKPIITVAQIMGQLGNNLFQVATACALAWDNGAEPRFPDLSSKSQHYQHVFFRCDNRGSNRKMVASWREPSYSYTPIVYQPNMSIYGYFQSEKYFAHHYRRLQALLAPHPDDITYMKQKYQWLFDHPCTVGVQIRDYKYELGEHCGYPQYGSDYLEKAMALFDQDALFVVSSNNMKFARDVIPTGGRNVVFLEGENYITDFYLLAFCKHTIITNSTFGWWTAWLFEYEGKNIVRPKAWTPWLPCQDVCPDRWISIDAQYS